MSDNSIFFKRNYQRLFDVPLLAFEYIGQQSGGVEESEDALRAVYQEVLSGICGVEFNQANIDYLNTRLDEAAKEAQSASKPTPKAGKGDRKFSAAFWEDFESTPLEGKLMQMVGYDYDKAAHLYCKVDREDVMSLLESFIKRLNSDQVIQLEACVFGFGGKMSKSEQAKEHDMSGHNPEAHQMLKNFF